MISSYIVLITDSWVGSWNMCYTWAAITCDPWAHLCFSCKIQK